jgi:hypothetical protein
MVGLEKTYVMKKLIFILKGLTETSLSTKIKFLFLLVLVNLAVSIVLPSPNKANAQVSGGPVCSRWRADFYGINDTASVRAGYNPYGNPGVGYTGPSREQIQISASAVVNPPTSCLQPSPMPGVITTNNCTAGSTSCPTAPRQYGGATDASQIAMYPPSSVFSNGVQLTYIGTSYEAGTSGYARITNGRNFPENSQVGSLNSLFRLIFHYVNCSDPIVAGSGYCPAPPAPSCSLNANPSSFTPPGSSILSWSSSNATSASINQGIGIVGTSGSRTVSPSSTTTYTLTVSGPGGTRSCSRTITVNNLVSCTLSPSPTSFTSPGSSTLTWTTSGSPTSASIDQGIGPVSTSGGSRSVSPGATTTYRLTVSNGASVGVCQTTVTVNTVIPVVCSLSASPTSFTSPGSSTLTWTTSGSPTSASIDQGIGPVSTSGGSISVSPSTTTTYRLSVSKTGSSDTCDATVTVIPGSGPGSTRKLGPWDSIINLPPVL